MHVTAMLKNEAQISYRWIFSALGIEDPCKKPSKHQSELETEKHFLEMMRRAD